MGKTEVYSWRVDPDLKRVLEAAARSEKRSVGDLLTSIARDWVAQHAGASTSAEQTVKRRKLEAILAEAEARDPGGPPVPSATNEVVRQAFIEKLEKSLRRRDPR